jgi:hypothetical protein
VVASVASVVLVGLAGGCESDKVPIESPSPGATARAGCATFLAALPNTVDDQLRRPVDPEDALGAAYGDPPIVVTCGGSMPADFDRFSVCQVADGVGWYVPEDQIGSEPVDVVMTTVGFRPVVRVRVPASYWPAGAPAAQIDLAPAIKRHLRLVEPCR